MTQICSHRTEKGASGVHEGAGGPASGQGTGEGRGGSGWKRRAAPETHTFRCRQVGIKQPLVVSDQGGTTAQWSFEKVQMVKVKMLWLRVEGADEAAGGGPLRKPQWLSSQRKLRQTPEVEGRDCMRQTTHRPHGAKLSQKACSTDPKRHHPVGGA